MQGSIFTSCLAENVIFILTQIIQKILNESKTNLKVVFFFLRDWACSKCGKITIGVIAALCITDLVVGLVCHFVLLRDKSFGGPYKREAVATDTKQCSKIGKNILDANGSAVDAAIAAVFCLGVISMHSSGIGGGGVMLLYNQTLKKATVIDFRETAPATAYWNMFKDREEKSRKGLFFCFCMILL